MRTTQRVPRRNLWCWLGLHRWALGLDVTREGTTVVATCTDCGLTEVASTLPA